MIGAMLLRKKDLICLVLLFVTILRAGPAASADHLSSLAERYENGEAMELRAEMTLAQVVPVYESVLKKTAL